MITESLPIKRFATPPLPQRTVADEPWDSVIVWNLDARQRPELEVEIQILETPLEIPGFYLAHLRPELEVEIIVADVDDGCTVYDAPPPGYADAYAMAI